MRVSNLVPGVYYKESRDFSFAGRIFECLLNYAKTGADLVNSSLKSENMRPMILDLLTATLGFESKHKYVTKSLVYLAGAFSGLLRKKGTLDSIAQAATILLTSQGISADILVWVDPERPYTINVILPPNMVDIILFEDILDYILPAGMTVDLAYATVSRDPAATAVGYSHDLVGVEVADESLGRVYSGDYVDTVEGLSYPYYYYKLVSLNAGEPLIPADSWGDLVDSLEVWEETYRSYYRVTDFGPGSSDFSNVVKFTQIKNSAPFDVGYYCQLGCTKVIDSREETVGEPLEYTIKKYLKQRFYESVDVTAFVNNTYYKIEEDGSAITEEPPKWNIEYMDYYAREGDGSENPYTYTQNVNPAFEGTYYKIRASLITEFPGDDVDVTYYQGSDIYTNEYTPAGVPENSRSLTTLGVVVSKIV